MGQTGGSTRLGRAGHSFAGRRLYTVRAFNHDNQFLGGTNYSYGYPEYYPNYGYGYGYGYSGPGDQYLEMPLDYPDYLGSYSGATFYPGQRMGWPNSLRQVQSALEREGYYSGPVDGVLGPKTREAIENYQRDHRLTVTGKVTSAMLNRMGL